MGFVGFEEVEMTKTEESLSDLDQIIIKDSFYAQILVFSSILQKFWYIDLLLIYRKF